MTDAGDASTTAVASVATGDVDARVQAALPRFLDADWGALAMLDGIDAERRSDRSVLALMQLARELHLGDHARARTAVATARAWRVNARQLRRVVLAGVNLDMVDAFALQGNGERCNAHQQEARRLLSTILIAAPAARVEAPPAAAPSAATGTAESYAAEVRRQRELIEGLRKTVHTLRAASDSGTPDAGLISRILAAKLTYLSPVKMASIARACRAIDEQCVPGVFIEAGCALGGSAILIASIKKSDRALQVYDVFGMIPSPTEEDTPDVHERYRDIVQGKSSGIDGDPYYGYETNLYDLVLGNFARFEIDVASRRVSLVRGLVQDTLTGAGPVAFAHIDLDWYDPVQVCLQRLHPRLSIGGSIILDDYHDWGGCRRAVDAFLGDVGADYVADDSARSMKLTKIAGTVSA